MKGRKPIPTALKVLAGNPGHRPLNRGEARLQTQMMRAPKHLDAEAKAEWRRIVRPLYNAGLLTSVDRAALAAYCQAYSRWVRASREMDYQDFILETDKGYSYPNPLLGIINGALDTMRKFAVEFGMTPSARSRVKAEKPEAPDELDKLLFGASVKVKNG